MQLTELLPSDMLFSILFLYYRNSYTVLSFSFNHLVSWLRNREAKKTEEKKKKTRHKIRAHHMFENPFKRYRWPIHLYMESIFVSLMFTLMVCVCFFFFSPAQLFCEINRKLNQIFVFSWNLNNNNESWRCCHCQRNVFYLLCWRLALFAAVIIKA